MTLQACHAMPSPGQQADTPRLHAARITVATDTSRVTSVSVTDQPEQAGKTVQMDAFDLLFARSVPPSNPDATDAMATITRGPQRAAMEAARGVRQLCEADSKGSVKCSQGLPTPFSVFAV